MGMTAGCLRCELTGTSTDEGWSCPNHGSGPALWRGREASYEALVEHLHRTDGFPSYLPWPLGVGWRVSDLASVIGPRPLATLVCASGATEPDGVVDFIAVTEEVGVGLGARCAGLAGPDPGPEVGTGRPVAHVRVEQQPVALWPVTPGGIELDRAVLVGEAAGRWLWLVLRPASALLLLREEWAIADLTTKGPALLALPFLSPPPPW